MHQVLWIRLQATNVAVCGQPSAGGPWDVLREPDQTSRHRELQRSCLWIHLDHRRMDPGEIQGCLSFWKTSKIWLNYCIKASNKKNPRFERGCVERSELTDEFGLWGIPLLFHAGDLLSAAVLGQLWSGLPPASGLLQWSACGERQLWVRPSVFVQLPRHSPRELHAL